MTHSRRIPHLVLLLLTLVAVTTLTALPAAAQTFPLTGSVLDVDPGNIVDTGAGFRFRINYRCASTTTDCQGVEVSYSLPPELVFVSAQGTGDVASIANPGVGSNGTVTFTFNAVVPAGNTGDLDVTVRFPNGSTPDGATATSTATATGTNVPNETTPPIDVTARASFMPEFSKTIPAGQAFLDQDTTYRLRIRPSGNAGSLNISGVVVVDTLPAGVVFVSASNGGVFDSGTNTVTWDNGGGGFSVNAGSNLDLTVTVRFETPTFMDGEMVTNSFDATVTPLGEAPENVGPIGLDHDVQAFVESPEVHVDKRLGGGHVSPATGQEYFYNVIVENRGNIPLDGITVTDTVPVELEVRSVATGQYTNPPATVTVSYSTNLGGPFVLGASPGGTNASLNIPALGPGEFVTEVAWDFAGPIPVDMRPSSTSNRAQIHVTLLDPDNAGNPVVLDQLIENCVDADFTATTMSGPATGSDNDCHRTRVSAPYSLSSPRKDETSSGPYLPGDTISFSVEADNQSQASDPLVDPILVDLLPANLAFVPASDSLSANGTGMTIGTFEEITNFGGTGRTLLRWSLTGTLQPGENVDLSFDTTVLPGAVAGTSTNTVGQTHNDPAILARCTGSTQTDTLDLDGDADTSETLCTRDQNYTIASVAQLESEKLVLGQCDASFSKFPDNGITVPGGTIDYQIRVTNIGTVPTTNFVIVDILPDLGDTGVLDTSPRDTGWRPFLAAPIAVPPGAAVFYSTAANPCRPEVGGPTTGCDLPNWSPTPPSPITDAASFKIEFGGLVLNPLDELLFDLRLIAPADAPLAGDLLNPVSGEIAWNSFAFGTDRVDGGFLNAEPLKVGIIVKDALPSALGDFVWLDSNGDGVQNDGPTGVNGVPVTLWGPGPDGFPATGDDIPLSSTITADDAAGEPGWYEFSNLPAGNYLVCFEPPINFDATMRDQGGDDALDSDVDPATECTPVTTLGVGEIDPTLDLGLLPPTTAALGNYVWFDRSGMGDQNEPLVQGVNGLTVELYVDDGDGNPEPGVDDGAPIAVTGTADDRFGNPGFYLFERLVPGVPYFVRFVASPTAFGFTLRDAAGDDSIDSDADTVDGTTPVVTLVAGEYNDTIDAGLVPLTGPLSLGNQVWLDDDNDGLFEPFDGELGTNGVRLNLYLDVSGDGSPQPNEFFAATATRTIAGRAGRYLFENLPAGPYLVEVAAPNFDPGAPLAGRVTSTGNDPAPDPDDDVDSDDNGEAVGVLVLSQAITLADGTEPTTEEGDTAGDDNSNLTVDFGFIPGVVVQEFDYGDAPDAASGTARGDYETRAIDAGPRHLFVPGMPHLGACVDADPGVFQNTDATADDAGAAVGSTFGTCAVAGDDEDGATFADLLLVPGTGSSVDVEAATGAADCTLNAWIDWDRSGIFGDRMDEQIAADLTLGAGSSQSLPLAVPVDAVPGFAAARFRCSTAPGLTPTGPAPDGEVEDYILRIEGTDLGDAPDTYPTFLSSGGPVHDVDPAFPLHLGLCVDTEGDAAGVLDATADDGVLGSSVVGPCVDDEDGVTFDTPIAACSTAGITVTASLPGFLDAFLDFDGDGQFTDAGEKIFSSLAVGAGSTPLVFNVPCGATQGTTFARFRLSSTGGLAEGGPAADGEVEDYAVMIASVDFGDAPDTYTTTFAANGPRHGVPASAILFLGTCVDTEADGQPSPGADGDDLAAGPAVGTCTGGDDEDGVTFDTPIVACGTADLTVTASTAGVVDGWIDFGGDGTFDAGDRILTGQALVGGGNGLSFSVPCSAVTTSTYARFRLSSAGVADPSGEAPDGEVEDYAVTVLGNDWGDAPDPDYPTRLASNGPRHTVLLTNNPTLGATVDSEADGQPTASHSGDDANGDDEDGVVIGGALVPGTTDTITITTGATGGLVNAWIDWNMDGDMADAGEQIATDLAVGAGAAEDVTVAVPVGVASGTSCLRVRISSAGGLAPTGAAPDGEVEDHAVALGMEDPRIGLAKEVRTIDRESPRRVLVTFDLLLENLGNVPLSDVGVTTDLATAFADAASFEVVSVLSASLVVEPAFDGAAVLDLLASGNSLASGETAMIELVVAIDPGTNPGPYECSSIVRGTSPGGDMPTDMSQDGGDPDPDGNDEPGDNDVPTIVIVPVGTDIPTVGEWGMILLALLLAGVALRRMRI